MHSVTARRTIQAPAEQVWALATDISRWPETISGVDSVEVLSEGDFGPGTRWRETRTMLGRAATEEMWVTATDPERSYTVEAESHGAHYVSRFSFTETAPEQTEVVLSFSGRPQGTVAKVVARVTRPVASRSIAKALQQDLDDLAAAAERPDRR